MLLDPQLYLDLQVTEVARSTFCQLNSVTGLQSFLSCSELATITSTFFNLMARLMQYMLYGAVLNVHAETSASAEHGGLSSDRGRLSKAHNSSTPKTVLAPSSFLGTINGAGFDL